MNRRFEKYTKENLEPIVLSSCSYAECLKKTGRIVAGGNYKMLKDAIIKFNIDTSHMLHQASNMNKEFKKFDNLIGTIAIKKRLINERSHRCENCSLETWQGNLIPLELHHIDGNNRNNSRENIQLLCCNCHALTENFRNRKRKNI